MLAICKELEADRFDLIVAIYCLCNDWHSGQWSRGYKISCQIQRHYKPRNIPCNRDDLDSGEWQVAAMIYDELEEKYSDKL